MVKNKKIGTILFIVGIVLIVGIVVLSVVNKNLGSDDEDETEITTEYEEETSETSALDDLGVSVDL